MSYAELKSALGISSVRNQTPANPNRFNDSLAIDLAPKGGINAKVTEYWLTN